MKDPETGRMVRAGDQKTVAATFRHDTSRNLDPQLHTHAVLANMVRGPDERWRTMSNEALYHHQKLIGMLYRSELAQGLGKAGLRDREDARRRAVRGRGRPPRGDRGVLDPAGGDRGGHEREGPGSAGREPAPRGARGAHDPRPQARRGQERAQGHMGETGRGPRIRPQNPCGRSDTSKEAGLEGAGEAHEPSQERGVAGKAVEWAVAHLAEREAVFARADVLAAALAWQPGAVSAQAAERALGDLERGGSAPCRSGAQGRRRPDHQQGARGRTRDDRADAERPGLGAGR